MIDLLEPVLLAHVRGERDWIAGTGVCQGQGSPAGLRVERQCRRDHGLDEGRTLHVAQLAPVEVAIGIVGFRPAQEDVAHGLHESLALDHAFAGMLVAALRQVVFQDRRRRLLHLQEQRVVLISTLQQHDERPRPDTADAHDLVSHVDDLEPFEEEPAIVLQRLPVGLELLVDHVFQLVDRETDSGGQLP